MVESRYAKSLLLAAQEKGEIDKVYQDVKKLKDTILSETSMFAISAPIYERRERLNFADSLCSDLTDTTKNFVKLVILKKRERFLPQIIESFFKIYNESIGFEEVEVTFPKRPDDKKIDFLKDKLEKFLNKKVAMKINIEPEIVAGVIIKTKSFIIDSSIQGYIKDIEKKIYEKWKEIFRR